MIRRVLVLVLLWCGAAHAENRSLAEARRAVEDVRYDDARRLLVEALERGASAPEELREIYFLSAATAVVLGQNDLAEQYYRRVLALDPVAKLPADASPKLREPFVAARAYMAAQGRLDVRVVRQGKTLEVTVSDPLSMVAAVTAIVDGAPLPKLAYAGQPVAIAPTGTVESVVILDQHGNQLRAIAVGGAAPAPAPAPVDTPSDRTPTIRRWQTWALPAGVLAATGIGFLIDARLAKGRLDDIIAADDTHFFNEAEVERRRWKRSTLVSGIAFGAAVACTVTAIVMGTKRSPSRTTVTATITGDHASVAIDAKF